MTVSLFLGMLFLAFSLAPSRTFAQKRTLTITLKSSSDSTIVLPDNFISFRTLRLALDSTLQLVSPRDFEVDTTGNRIRLSPALRELIFPTGSTASAHRLSISYFALPLTLKKSYTLHKTIEEMRGDTALAMLDTGSHTLRRVANTEEPASPDFASRFQKSGSISRGFQLGSSRDLSLTSGFNLQFTGDLGNDVTLTGALTEENTPIQPEGTTQTLQDVDKVFITVNAANHFKATLGDFFLNLNGTPDFAAEFQSESPLGVSTGSPDIFQSFTQSNFARLSRKLLGAEAIASTPYGSLLVSGAATRGKFNTNKFQGQESFQGPYRLTGTNGEPVIIVIAGTERVYVDGVLQVRGQQNDYIIDYGLAEIRFQARRLITSSSRITIDFEYSDQHYSRSLLAGTGNVNLLNNAINFSTTYIREGDNQDVPLDLSLSDADRSVLAGAGFDPTKATKTGVQFAGTDANGRAKGSYVRLDSVVSNIPQVIYQFNPSDTVRAIYNVTFGYTGSGKGSYTRQSIGEFSYVGLGNGDYDTLVFLPLPKLTQVMSFNGSLRPLRQVELTGEYARSQFSPNRFASGNIGGSAYRAGLLIADSAHIFSNLTSSFEVRATTRQLGNTFTPIDRIQDVEFDRRYGYDNNQISSSTSIDNTGEKLSEGSIVLSPVPRVRTEFNYSQFDKPLAGFSSSRINGRIETMEDSSLLPRISLSAERLPVRDTSLAEQSVWRRFFGNLGKSFWLGGAQTTLGIAYGTEDKQSRPLYSGIDSLTAHSFSFQQIAPSLLLRLSPAISFRGQYDFRTDDSGRFGLMRPISRANTETFNATLQSIGGFSALLDLTLRQKNYIDSASKTSAGGDQSSLLLHFEPRYSLRDRGLSMSLLYELSNQRAARLEQVFLPVPKGLGSYRYLGDLNHNGRADANEFAPARYSDEGVYILLSLPTQQLFPTIDLRSQFRLQLSPADLLFTDKTATTLARIFALFSTETALRIEETSRDEHASDIYLFRLSHFQNDSTTLHGLTEFEQDVNFLENNTTQSYRFHYLIRSQANQFNTGLDKTHFEEESLRARLRPSYEITNETMLGHAFDQAISDTLSLDRPHRTNTFSLSTDWSYHPLESLFDYGLKLEGSHSAEQQIEPFPVALYYGITARSGYSLASRARLRAEIERDELDVQNAGPNPLLLPYALTSGRTPGTTWLWRLALDYHFGSGVTATVSYDGRNYSDIVSGLNGSSNTASGSSDRITVHNARAEVRATF